MAITPTKKKKDGLTQYRVRVSYKDNGEFKVKEKRVYGLQAAKEAEAELSASPVKQSRMTLNELIVLYTRSRKGQVRETTADKCASYLKLYVIPQLGDRKLDALSLPSLLEWKTFIGETPLSVVTKNNIYSAFSAVLNFGVMMEYLPKNNLKALGGFKDAVASPEDKRFRYYTAEQFKRYISVIPRETFEDNALYTFFMLAFYTGARKGEINALKWSDLEGNLLHVRRSVAQKIKGKSFVETPPKNKSSYRDIMLPKVLTECLQEHKKLSQTFGGFSEDWRICGGDNILSDNLLFCRNKKYATQAGLPRITIHEFRHSHASLLINAGINIKEISRRLGHSTVEMTWGVYSHLYPDQELKVLEALDNA